MKLKKSAALLSLALLFANLPLKAQTTLYIPSTVGASTNSNVGIGTASPAQKLHVVGNLLVSGGRVTAGNGTSNGNTSGIWLWVDGDSNHVIYSANSASGVRPGGSVAGDAPDNRLGSNGEHRMRFRTYLTQGWLFENSANVGVIDFSAADGSAYFAGNVGIGTTTLSHKLAVNGTVRAKEVIVDTGWSDFVFDDNYQLAPLSEVEAHIRAEKHLPGIPTAQQVAEEGVSLGDMQAKLLAKVEELTLHLIEQEKQISEQGRAIHSLQTELVTLRKNTVNVLQNND